MLLYLNPFGFGGTEFGMPYNGPGEGDLPNLSNIMGIGGYQKVIKVSSSIDESGKFETTVDCIFEHTGEKDSKNIRATGKEQQKAPKLSCQEADKIEDQDCAFATDISRRLQNELYNIKNEGTIDNPSLEDETE